MYDLEFTPKTEKEVSSLLQEGVGQFEVLKALKKISQAGNSYIALTLKCWDKDGNQGLIFENIMNGEHPFILRKIRHFCYAVGLENEYESGKLNADMCLGRSGIILIGIQKDKNGKNPDKNCALDFLKPLEKSKLTSTPLKELNDNLDDLPF